MRVMIVEDQPYIALELAEAMRRAGHEVVGPAAGALEAIALACEHALDCAIVDDDIDGEAPIGILKVLAERRIPFVYVSSFCPSATRTSMPEGPALSKPVDMQALLNLVRALRFQRPRHSSQRVVYQ